MTEKEKKIALRVSKTPVLYTAYLLLSLFVPLFLKYTPFEGYIHGFWTDDLYSAVGYAYSLVVLFSLISIFVLYDMDYRKRFLSNEENIGGFWGKIGFVLRSHELWIDIISFTVLCFIIPGWTYNDFRYLFVKDLNRAWHLPIFVAVSCLLFMLVSVIAYFATVLWWARPAQKRKYRQEKDKNNVVALLKQLVFSVPMYCVGAFALAVVVPIVWSVILTFWMFIATMTLLTLTVILIYVGTKYVRALYHRRRLMKKMKAAMKNGYCSLIKAERVYSSVFSSHASVNFILKKGTKRVYCKIITPLRKRYTVSFDERGWVTFEQNIMIAKLYKSDRYFFEAEKDAEKVIIVNPGVLHMFATDGLHNRELHSGERTMGYCVYRTDNFINSIERKYL